MGLRDSRWFLFVSLLWGVFSSHLFDHTIWLPLSAPNHFYLVNVTSQHLQRDVCSCEDRFEDNCCCDQQCDLTMLYFHLTLCQVNTQPLIFEAHFHIHAESQHNELEMLKALHKYGCFIQLPEVQSSGFIPFSDSLHIHLKLLWSIWLNGLLVKNASI